MLNIAQLLRSFRSAARGIAVTHAEEQNFRVQTVFALCSLALGIIFRLHAIEYALLIIAITLVLVGEMLNTALERFIDIIHPRVSHYVRDLKDILAGIVLLCSFASILIGMLIFLPRIIALVIY